MNRTLFSLLLAGIAVQAPHVAAQFQTSGSVTGGGLSTHVNSGNPFRFEEYRDLRSGGTLGADIKGESDTRYLRFFGENLGRDDQFAEFRGGKYGAYKFSIYNNDIIHNLTFNARTPYTSGLGTNNLSFAGAGPASTNTATWTPFDYSIQHQNYGGTLELQSLWNTPYYFRTTANQKETRGIKPLGVTANTFGGPAVELPAPVDYLTTDASGEVGYATRTRHYSLNVSNSRFQDNFDNLTWRVPIATSGQLTDVSTLSADNQQWRIAANAIWKQMPMGSTLALRATHATLTNNLPVRTSFTTVAAGVGTANNVNASSLAYDGDIVHETASASWTAQPFRALDTRLYYNYDKKENDSTKIVFTPVAGTTGRCDIVTATGLNTANNSCTTEAFHYEKNNFGVDLRYRVNPPNKLSGGWDYTETTRERIDFDTTEDNKYYVEWKNSSLDLLSTKVKYQRLQRRSDFLLGGVNPAANNNSFFNYYVKRFDLVDNDQDLLKLVVDSNPVPLVDLGAELILKNNDYRNVLLGRTGDQREELYLTAGYGDIKRFRVTAFFDYERTNYESLHWQGTPNATLSPTGGPPSTAFLWSGKVQDRNYVAGLAAEWPYREWLRFKGALIWQETDGMADFATNGVNVPVFPITAYDSFHKQTLNLSAIYSVDKKVDITFGAAYEEYDYDDAQMNGYSYTPLTGTTTHYLSGAYAFPSYNASIFYVTVKYKM